MSKPSSSPPRGGQRGQGRAAHHPRQPAQARPRGRHRSAARRRPSAVNELTFSKKRIAQDVKKALNSAIANAENNHKLDVDRLIVAEASVGKGLVMKRFQTRGRGRAAGIIKPFSHLTIVVRERAEAEDK